MLHHITGPRPLHTLVVAALLFSASLNLYLLHSKVQLGVGDGADGDKGRGWLLYYLVLALP